MIALRPWAAALAVLSVLSVAPAVAQQTAPPSEDERAPVDLFGFQFNQSERYKFGGELVVGWSHDGAQAALGFEKQGRVGMAILSLSGRVSDHVRYYVSVNPVSETTSRPQPSSDCSGNIMTAGAERSPAAISRQKKMTATTTNA